MTAKEILDTIWKYLLLGLLVWALALMSGHCACNKGCDSRAGCETGAGCGSEAWFHGGEHGAPCGGFKAFSHGDIDADIEQIEDDDE